ncbi:MAG: alpha/beta hydrolase, partial [Pseudomonadota bacterium]
DTIELIEHLQSRLGIEKVVLVGHSWGSMLGIGVIQERPDLIHAYVGVGQALGWHTGFDETRRLVTEAAKAAGDQETLDAYTALPEEWPSVNDFDAYFAHIEAIQTPLQKYKVGVHAAHDSSLIKNELVLDAIVSPEMTLFELPSLVGGDLGDATKSLVRDLSGRHIANELGTDYNVPIFIFQGEHDWQTPTTLVKAWFPTLKAPYKEYIAFEDSAHFVFNEEQGKFITELVTKVRPFATGDRKAAPETFEPATLLEDTN